MLRLFLMTFTALLLLPAGCASNASNKTSQLAPTRSASLPNLSGHWEKNYQLSDDFNSRFELYIADIQRRYTSPQNNSDLQAIAAARGIRSDAINGLARFAEAITRMPLLDIEQTEHGAWVEREQDFTLRCLYEDKQFIRSENIFGADICGWNGEQLLFQMNMSGGLSIAHQFSISPDLRLLNVTSTINSDAVVVPIVIRNVYRRYEIPQADYECELTLTRNTVCSQRGSQQ